MRWPLSIADWHTLSTNQSAPTSFFLQQTRVLSWTGSTWYLDNVPCFWHPNWDRRCNLNFTSAASHSDLSWPLLCSDSDLASFSWILMARLWDPETLTFYVSPKQTLPGCASSLRHGLVPWGHSHSNRWAAYGGPFKLVCPGGSIFLGILLRWKYLD